MTSLTSRYFHAAARCTLITVGSLVAAVSLQAQQNSQSDTKTSPSQTRSSGTQSSDKSHNHYAKSGDTATCLKEAAQMNTAMIQYGQLAAQKGENAELKRFGEELQMDHKKAQAKLETIAQKHNVTLPTSLDEKCQEEMSKIRGLSGAEFDKEFAKGAVQGHAMALAHLRQPADKDEASDLTAYKKELVTALKRHQERAREVAKAVGLDQATIASLETPPREGVGTSGAESQTERGTSSSERSEPKSKDSSK